MPMKKSFGGFSSSTWSGTRAGNSSRGMNESQRRCAEAMSPKTLSSIAKNKKSK